MSNESSSFSNLLALQYLNWPGFHDNKTTTVPNVVHIFHVRCSPSIALLGFIKNVTDSEKKLYLTHFSAFLFSSADVLLQAFMYFTTTLNVTHRIEFHVYRFNFILKIKKKNVVMIMG